MASVNPDVSADCHASGSAAIDWWAVNGMDSFSLCGHHARHYQGALVARGWTLVPTKREARESSWTCRPLS